MVILALLAVSTDARELYLEIQDRLRRAEAIQWDSTNDALEHVDFIRPNRFRYGVTGHVIRSDGKWFLEEDFGKVTHRPSRKTDVTSLTLFTQPGSEALAGRPMLDVFGAVLETATTAWNGPVWKISYRSAGSTRSLYINSATRLPLGITIRKASELKLAPVPGERTGRQMQEAVRKRLSATRVLLFERASGMDGTRANNILLARNRDPYLLPPFGPKERDVVQETSTRQGRPYRPPSGWNQKFLKEPLFGFECLTGKKLFKVDSPVRVGDDFGGTDWILRGTIAGGEQVSVAFDLRTELPRGYWRWKDGKVFERITYTIWMENPHILLRK